MNSLTVVAIFRNEAPYLAEFIAFHLAQGVERFHLYNNRSTDNFYEALEPFADVVDLIDWDRPAPCQMEAYADYFHGVQQGRYPATRWAAVLDVDEFLFATMEEPRTLLQTLDSYGAAGAAGVGVNWMIYNGSEHEARPDGLQIEAFTERCAADHGANRHIKSIVDPMKVTSIRDPHSFGLQGVTVDELGRTLPGPYTETPTHQRLRINHYLIRSRAEWAEKVARGRADTGTMRSLAELNDYPVDAVDLSAAYHAQAVRAILEQRKTVTA